MCPAQVLAPAHMLLLYAQCSYFHHRFCLSAKETPDPTKFCGTPGFIRYCCTQDPGSAEDLDKLKEEKVYQLNEENKIECVTDDDCPPPYALSEWDGTLGTIGDIQVERLYCSPDLDENYEYDEEHQVCTSGSTSSFCDHILGTDHPECKRCSSKNPDPPCPDSNLRRCCENNFSPEAVLWRQEELEELTSNLDYSSNYVDFDLERINNLETLISSTESECLQGRFNQSILQCAQASAGAYPRVFSSGLLGQGSLQQVQPLRSSRGCPAKHCQRPSVGRRGRLR